MKFRTEIKPPQPPFRITDSTRILTFGSCFAQHIGGFLAERFLDVRVNPAGTLFNPVSIRHMLERMARRQLLGPDDVFYHDGQWKSFALYTLFNRPGRDEFLAHANEMIEQSHAFLRRTDIVIITYGTAQVFVHKAGGQIVANCHKLPAAEFEKRMLTIDEILDHTRQIYRLLRDIQPEMKFIFSVSPVRYLQEGMTANIRSKGRLIDAVVSFTEQHPDTAYYFPAFEIFNDDLRDYRFYAADLIHPGEQGIRYTTEIFENLFFDEKGKTMLREAEKLAKFMAHRPLLPSAGRDKERQIRIREMAENLRKRYPGLRLPAAD